MNHLHVLYFFTTFSIGIPAFIIAVIAYHKTRDPLVGYSLYFHLTLSIMVVSLLFSSYLHINMSHLQVYWIILIEYPEFIGKFLLMSAIPMFIHCLCGIPGSKIRNTVIAALVMTVFIVQHFITFVLRDQKLKTLSNFIEDLFFITIVLYSVISGLYYYKRLQDSIRKRFARRLMILFWIFLPGIFSDIFLSSLFAIRFYPLLYCGFSIMCAYHLIKFSLKSSQAIRTDITPAPADDVFEKYNISLREKEIVLLILQGYSNKKIAETLYISLSTVKTHARNIYAKFGLKSRYELLALFKDIHL